MMLTALRWLLAIFMFGAGVMHFRAPRAFQAIVPKQLPSPKWIVIISGVFEMLGGLGLLIPPVSQWAAWGIVALLVCVFPANVNMAVNKIPMGKKVQPTWALWLRLPIQGVLIAWAWLFT